MSTWKERAIKRNNFRHDHGTNVRPKGGSKKDTKRWCRGKIGVEHVLKCGRYAVLKGLEVAGSPLKGFAADWRILYCTECGKEIDYYMPMTWTVAGKIQKDSRRPIPSWVTE